MMIMKGINIYRRRYLYFNVHTKFLSSISDEEVSLVQFISDIEFILHKMQEEGILVSISHYQLGVIKNQIASGKYVLSPLRYMTHNKSEFGPFCRDTLNDYPDITIGSVSLEPNKFSYIKPGNKEDALVLMGLALMLLRLSGNMPPYSYRLEKKLESFYDSLPRRMGWVDRLYKIDLTNSISIIDKNLLLERVHPIVGKGYVYKLISSFLTNPILDDHGNDYALGGIPPMGEMGRILLHVLLQDILDELLSTRYPKIRFARFNQEIYISTHLGNEDFDANVATKLLEELRLVGTIESIGPGDDPISCYYYKMISVNTLNHLVQLE